ncbi:MAG: threonine synthase [Oscillospiraceae bacterium]|jgi:threonine synthase|nr:threonine synthase [Oscillospiraceae bacterium]
MIKYNSTRNNALSLSGAEAILQGLSTEGGLLVPDSIPLVGTDDIQNLLKMSYAERSAYICSLFLTDYSREELLAMTNAAYGAEKFDVNGSIGTATENFAAPLYKVKDNTYVCELWHGPTAAFKDIALQMLPRFMSAALTKTGAKDDVLILVATSGDTGKAALEGFCDVDRCKIQVFYPKDGVSDVQKLQMTSQAGQNVGVSAILGNFDDAQTGVKNIFGDKGFAKELSARGTALSSANSINWGRLLPQIVYYFSAYCDLVNDGEIAPGDKLDFCVPTGNFGNILAGYYARKMGLPVRRLICASNRNDVLTEFFATGVYNRNREFFTTESPSMDILVSSNLERLLYHEIGDAQKIAELMAQLSQDGKYTVPDGVMDSVRGIFTGGTYSDESGREVIADLWYSDGYLIDTHTAVAYGVLEQKREAEGEAFPTVVLSTASPYKFCGAVLSAVTGGTDFTETDGVELIDALYGKTRAPVPRPLAGLAEREVRFPGVVTAAEMKDEVRRLAERV